MNYFNFTQQNPELINSVANLVSMPNGKVHRNLEGIPYVNSSNNGFYFRLDTTRFLTDQEQDFIRSRFPIKIDGYEFILDRIMNFDWDDDRPFLPSIHITVKKDGQFVIEN